MAQLSDVQLVILSAASQRPDLAVLPLPDGLKVKGGAVQKVLTSLRNKGLIQTIETPGRPERVVLTREGLAAIGLEPEDEAPAVPDTGASTAEAEGAGETPAEAAEADTAAPSAEGKPEARRPEAAAKPTPREGTKQALLIGMLQRPDGATVDEVVAATGWQKHTVRGAISGALKKKLSLAVTSEKVEGRGRVYRIAGSGAAS